MTALENQKFKAAIFITVRLKSTRLPMKALKPILGKPMIEWQVDRLKKSSIRPIVLMTSTNLQDDPLIEIAQKENIEYFRGDERDVLLRMRDCARKFSVDFFISVTGDNPFVEPIFINQMEERYQKEKFDFCEIKGVPIGTFSYAISRNAIEKVCEIKDTSDTEIWGNYFREAGVFKCAAIEVTNDRINRPNYRLTVDVQKDFELVEKICAKLSEKKKDFDIYEICKLLDENPDLAKSNSAVQQMETPPTKFKKGYK